MKGKIDVSLNFEGSSNVIPLELKTGKSGSNIEHRAQVVAYSLMLSDEENPETVPGILLYLRDNVMRPIVSSDIDIAGFLTLRNEMSGWFSEFDIEELPNIEKPSRLCERCEQLSNCALIEKLSINSSLPEPISDSAYELHNLMKRTTEHLTEVELEYARQWIKWTLMEWETNFRDTTTPTISQNQTSNSGNRNDSYYTNGLTLQNISTLMANTDEARRLRSLLIERKPPKFSPEIKLPESVETFLADLDTPQRAAVDHCIAADDYAIIQGLPGAGKTTMIAALVASLVKMRKSVLLASHTHSAVDNVMMKLKGSVPDFQILRLGAEKSLHPDVLDYGLDARIEKISGMSRLDLTQKMGHLKRALFFIVGATCLMTSSHSLFTKRRFDYCIIDEASLALESVALGPLFASEKFILVGDTKQLCPLVVNKEAAQQGMSVSLMERLSKEDRVSQDAKSCEAVSLTWQYRMNREICDLASSLFYNSKLVCANSSIELATLKCESIQDENIPSHISNVLLSSDLSHSVMFIDVQSEAIAFQSKTDPTTKSRYNEGEASVVNKLVKSLMDNKVHHSGIGVITPFRAQAECLLKIISDNHTANEYPEVSTIDRYQGRDKSVIILSLTYGHNEILANDTTSHLADERRINVAFTRAKHKLILINNHL
ncbi:DNA replication ATP-dependent helicase-like protein [Aphelenchoides besseyi]|nr:DNA replication ATP-dependent helicase-like protein [Aphelenchoides besseyi]